MKNGKKSILGKNAPKANLSINKSSNRSSSFLNYSIGSLIESTDVHMNIARVVNVGLTSILDT